MIKPPSFKNKQSHFKIIVMGKMDHITPDLAPKYDEKKAEAAAKAVETLKEKEADLVKQLNETRKEISVKSAEARAVNHKPGFSNAVPVKEAKAEVKETPVTKK